MPIGWAWAPPLIVNWLNKLKIRGERVGNRVHFKIEEIKEGLRKQNVPHVADALENKDLEYDAENCIEQEI